MVLLASRKMENISRKCVLYMKTLGNNCLKSFQLLSVEASYVVALHIANAKKSHTIAELVQPCLRNCAKIVLDDRACSTLKQVSPSNNTIKIFAINPRMEMLVK